MLIPLLGIRVTLTCFAVHCSDMVPGNFPSQLETLSTSQIELRVLVSNTYAYS